MTTTPQPTARRRFRFGLRTLLVVVTLLCVSRAVLERQLQIVHARQTFIDTLRQNQWGFWGLQKDSVSPENLKNYSVGPIPAIRSLLGDEAYFSVSIKPDANPALIEEAHKLFPEAMIGRARGSFEQVYAGNKPND